MIFNTEPASKSKLLTARSFR